MGAAGMAAASQGSNSAPQAQQPPPQQPQQQPSGGGLGGRLGRLGRIARGSEPQPSTNSQAGQAPPSTDAGVMLETTTEVVSWSAAPIDAAQMQVPAGFKQVERPLKKQLK